MSLLANALVYPKAANATRGRLPTRPRVFHLETCRVEYILRLGSECHQLLLSRETTDFCQQNDTRRFT